MKFSVRSFFGAPLVFQERKAGRIKGFFFDPDTGKMTVIQFSERGFFSASKCFVHSDFLEIASRERVKKSGKNLLGFSVIGISGERFGRITDIFCDSVDLRLSEVHTKKKTFFGIPSRRIFSTEKILHIRGTTLVVDDDNRRKDSEMPFFPLLSP